MHCSTKSATTLERAWTNHQAAPDADTLNNLLIHLRSPIRAAVVRTLPQALSASVDDATQAGLVKAWSHLHKIKGSIKSWAWGIGRNAALDLIRKDNRRPVDEFDPERDAPIAEAISNEEMPSSLTPEERAFAYEWVEHGSEREVSEALGMSRRAVRKVIAAITDKYQECYAERYQNPGV